MSPNQVATDLYGATHRLIRSLRAGRRENASSGERLSAMLTLQNFGHSSIKDLAKSEQVAHSTMSRMVSGMADKGLARAYVHENDRRTSSVELTAKGRAAAKRDLEDITAPLAAAIQRLSKRDQATLLRSLSILSELIDSVSSQK